MAWGEQAQKTAAKSNSEPTPVQTTFDRSYYLKQFKAQSQQTENRMALVGHENTAKTGLAASFLDAEIQAGKSVYILDVDNSARSTLDYIYPDKDNIKVIPLLDEMDDSIFHDDNSINYMALIDKTKMYVNIIAGLIEDGEDVGGVIFDGGSTFLKWCEFAMRQSLLSKGIIENEDDSFNQKEWRTRNQLFRDTITRLHGLPVDKVYFTFHLKDDKQYADLGNGSKGLMKVGERPDWVDGTQRIVSQQLFMGRYQKKGDSSAGVYADSSLDADEWVIKARIEEIKGKGMDLVGQDRVILSVKNGKVDFKGLPELRW